MIDHWESFGPPTYVSAAAYLGLGNKGGSRTESDKTDKEKYGDLEELVRMFEGTGGAIGG